MEIKIPIRYKGRKTHELANKIINCFKPHDLYVEPFFGVGGVYFRKKDNPLHTILNDKSDEIYNFWNVFMSEVTQKLKQI